MYRYWTVCFITAADLVTGLHKAKKEGRPGCSTAFRAEAVLQDLLYPE